MKYDYAVVISGQIEAKDADAANVELSYATIVSEGGRHELTISNKQVNIRRCSESLAEAEDSEQLTFDESDYVPTSDSEHVNAEAD